MDVSEQPYSPDDEEGMPGEDSVQAVPIENELSSAYLDYAMSVIVSRALPDLRDGLKPVHRRILYAMHDTRNTHDQPYRKSARPVGEVMGKYHPHGDSAIYEALVRMTQEFTMSLPLLDGQGNFGSVDGDSAAAMRYTEIRMAPPAESLLDDIGLDTVDFQANYDGKDQEPVVLPARFPNILVNGGSGIAVGMASKIPPYNLGEVIDATIALIDDPDISSEQLIELLPAPDFPTGGTILGMAGSISTFHKGEGKIIIRARTEFEHVGNRCSIIVTEIPYLVIKSEMIAKIAEFAGRKRSDGQSLIEGISSIRDESDRTGIRVVIELERDAVPELVLNQLWHHTPLQSSFSSNVVALNRGQPMQIGVRNILDEFITFREEIVTRRTSELLRRSRDRSHVLCGLAVAATNLDEVVGIIRGSASVADAREILLSRHWPAGEIAEYIKLIDDPLHQVHEDETYRLSRVQVQAILDLRLQRLTAMGVKENTDELQKRSMEILDFLDILQSGVRVRKIIREDLAAVRHEFAVPRRTQIEENEDEIIDDDLISRENMAVIATHGGYFKRCPLSEFTPQGRGGKGRSIQSGDDQARLITFANTHDELLCFATDGLVYKLKTWRLPLRARNATGLPITRFWSVDQGVSLAAILPTTPEDFSDEETSLVIATSDGRIRRGSLSDYRRVNRTGKIGFSVSKGVDLISVSMGNVDMDVIQLTKKGDANRFSLDQLRVIKSRTSPGVKGIKTSKKNRMTGAVLVPSLELTRVQREDYLVARRNVREYLDHVDAAEDDFISQLNDSQQDQINNDLEEFLQKYGSIYDKEKLILILATNGTGKITSSHEIPTRSSRTSKGVRAYRNAKTAALLVVEKSDQILVVTESGRTLRSRVSSISYRSRVAGGVKVIDTDKTDKVVFATVIKDGEDEPVLADETSDTGFIDPTN